MHGSSQPHQCFIELSDTSHLDSTQDDRCACALHRQHDPKSHIPNHYYFIVRESDLWFCMCACVIDADALKWAIISCSVYISVQITHRCLPRQPLTQTQRLTLLIWANAMRIIISLLRRVCKMINLCSSKIFWVVFFFCLFFYFFVFLLYFMPFPNCFLFQSNRKIQLIVIIFMLSLRFIFPLYRCLRSWCSHCRTIVQQQRGIYTYSDATK